MLGKRLKFAQPETNAVAERILQLVELQQKKKGLFKPNGDKDVLSTVIWSKKHGGCWNYGLGPFILINAIKEFKAHY